MGLLDDHEPIGPSISKYLVEYLSRHPKLIPTSEKISVSILAIGLFLNFFKIENTGYVLIVGSVLTALTYFLSAFQIVKTGELETTGILNSAGFIMIIYRFYFFALSLTAIAALGFVFKTFPYLKTLTTISLIFLIIVLIISIITRLNDRSVIYNSVFYIRIVPAILLSYFLSPFFHNSGIKVTHYFNSGIAKYEKWDYKGAFEDFNNEIKNNPGNAQAYYYRGKISYSDSSSLADFSKAIEINPDYVVAYYERGITRLHLGDFSEAYKDLTKAESYPDVIFPQPSETKYYALAEGWKAISHSSAQIQSNQHDAEAYYMRGWTKCLISDGSGAMEDLNKAIEIDSNHAQALSLRGDLRFNNQDYAGAISDLTRANVTFKRWAINWQIGDAKYYLGDYRGAIADYDKSPSDYLDKSAVSTYLNKGNAELKIGDSKAAIAAFSMASASAKTDFNNPDLPNIIYDIANLRLNSGDYTGAHSDFWQVIQLDPGNAKAYYGRGSAIFKLGDKKRACQDWRKASELGYEKANESIRRYCK